MSDYISREKTIDRIRYGARDKAFFGDPIVDKAVIEYLDSLQGVDAREVIYGEWIPKERTTECSVDIDIVCSECGYVGVESYAHGYELDELPMQEMKDFVKKFDMNYCTCCGADMRGKENE